MGRIVAIDYGTKRTGLAATDPLQIIANGLTTVPTVELLPYLQRYCAAEPVESFVVGLPRRLNNEPSQSAPAVEAFARQLEVAFPTIPVRFYDERFTSKIAFQAMIDGGLKKSDRRNKALIDEISAVVILQSYMESCR